MMNKIITLMLLLAATVIASNSVYAAGSNTDTANQSVEQIITEKIELLTSEGVPLEEAVKAVTRRLAESISIQQNLDLVTSIYAALAKVAEESGAGINSESYQAAMAATSALLINDFGISEGSVVELAIAAKIDPVTVTRSLPRGGEITADSTPQTSDKARAAALKGIITTNTARSGGGAGSPAS
jgi:hypothetical protein